MSDDTNSDYEGVKGRTISFIAEILGKDPRTINPESNINDIADDSIQLFELLLAFEKQYDVETDYDDVVRLQTVEDVIQYTLRIIANR